MSEEQGSYLSQPAAIIDPPRIVKSISENGVSDYRVWGWVKLSAKFIYHIRKLKGAKLAIMMTLALSVDETGKCKRTIKQLCELTDYSHTEVIASLKELDEMGYLSVQRDAKGNIYDPEFVARGENLPSDTVKKLDSTALDSTPVYQVESTPSEEDSSSIPLRVKRVKDISNSEMQEIQNLADKDVDSILRFEALAKQAETEGKAWRGREFLVGSEYCKYGDWFHAKTGWQMYGARSKAKQDSTAMTEFKKWWEDDVTLETLDKAYEVENDWRKVKSGLDQNITHPRELTAKAKAIQAAPQVKNTQDNPEGKGFYV